MQVVWEDSSGVMKQYTSFMTCDYVPWTRRMEFKVIIHVVACTTYTLYASIWTKNQWFTKKNLMLPGTFHSHPVVSSFLSKVQLAVSDLSNSGPSFFAHTELPHGMNSIILLCSNASFSYCFPHWHDTHFSLNKMAILKQVMRDLNWWLRVGKIKISPSSYPSDQSNAMGLWSQKSINIH